MSTEGRVEDARFIDVKGVEQWITVRGSRGNPPLLIVGGPGLGYAALAPFFAEWEAHFTLVQWDQPGAGFTFGRSRVEAATIERLSADALEVADYARRRLGVPKVGLLAFSAGTIVGLDMVARRPDLFATYVGSGQFVDWARQDALSYELLRKRARERGDSAMQAELEAIGPPPYPDTATDAVKSKYAGAPTPREAAALAAFGPVMAAASARVPEDASYFAAGVDWPEPFPRALAAYTALRRDLVSFDARRLGREFAVDMFFLQGADDLFSVTSEVERYAAEITAPHVELMTIPDAGHAAFLLRDEVLERLCERVRPRLLAALEAV
jgi:pimeloyl-ACP methyl ester carboxylesterase